MIIEVIVAGVIITVMGNIFSREITQWIPYIARKIVVHSTKKLCDSEQEIRLEEWMYELEHCPGDIGKIFFAVGTLRASQKMAEFPNIWRKTLFDRIIVCFLLITLIPVLLLIALAIKLDTTGPIIFKQRRYGLDGREIVVWKFRTMSVCNDESTKTYQTTESEPRVTRIGQILRVTSLDELPQLINVLQGSLSLVGPRPCAVAINEQYYSQLKEYQCNLKIKPGITGLAQINGYHGDTDSVKKLEQRIQYDKDYIKSWSLWLDIKILIKTLIILPFQK